ncbi:MAG: DMT family transporter [Candidatus Thorarchaeota archaeon]|nr:DMT family transporter [Candidatus Thorarchaeota archaeon]
MLSTQLRTGVNLRVVLLLLLSVSMVSSASILIRFSTSPPLVIVFWRTLLGAAVMGGIGLARGDHRTYSSDLLHDNWKWLIFIGVVLSLHFSTWFTSLFMTTVAASVVLVNTSPILTGVLSTLLLGESLRRRSWIGIIIAVSGAIFLAWSDLVQSGFGALQGDLLALLSALFLAIYFIGGRRYAIGLPITVYTSIVYLTAAFCTLMICLVAGLSIVVLEPTEIVIFIALAVFPTALGHSVNNYLLTIVPAHVVSSAVLGEPVGATLLAAVFLQETPRPITIVWFSVILLGIGVVISDLASQQRDFDAALLSLDDPDGP